MWFSFTRNINLYHMQDKKQLLDTSVYPFIDQSPQDKIN